VAGVSVFELGCRWCCFTLSSSFFNFLVKAADCKEVQHGGAAAELQRKPKALSCLAAELLLHLVPALTMATRHQRHSSVGGAWLVQPLHESVLLWYCPAFSPCSDKRSAADLLLLLLLLAHLLLMCVKTSMPMVVVWW